MVHSDSSSPMTTNPSAPPQLTAPAAEPLLHEAPLPVPPSGDNTGPDSSQPSILSTDLPPSSDLSQTSIETNPSPSLTNISTQASALIPVNGRTSGRKRTPKACDCCGPHGRGHNAIKTYSRGRGRGRGKSIVKDIGETPKRKASQLTQISSFDLTNEIAQHADSENNMQIKMPKTETETESQPHTLPPPPPPAVPVLSGSVTNCVENVTSQRNEDKLMTGTAPCADGAKEGGGNGGPETGLSVETDRGDAAVIEGKRMMGTKSVSNLKGDIGINKWGDSVLVVGSKTDFPARSVEVQSEKKSKDAELESGDDTPCSVVKSLFQNGDTVNLSDSEPEGDQKDNDMILCEQENGLRSDGSGFESRSIPLDQDSVIQVDLCDSLSNGIITSLSVQNHASTPMEVETPHLNLGPVTVCKLQHQWAVRDHRLYCRPGTWEKEKDEGQEEKEVVTQEVGMYEHLHNEERLEQLTDMVHDFLESFYMKYGSFIPLSETDVVEHLKKHGNSDHSKCGLNIKAEVRRYRSGLASAPIAGFSVMHNKHNLSLEDLSTLEEQNWLNDQIINMYGELIMEATGHKVHFFNSFFHKQLVAKGYDGVKRWTKKVDLFSKWLLLIPIHLEIHWSLVTVTMATKTISYYDSQGIVFRHTTDNIMKYLQSEAKEKEQTSFQKGWKITIIKGIPQQKNDSDCGVFVLEYCRRLSVKQPLLFSQEDMPRIRKRIYKELCDCRFDA